MHKSYIKIIAYLVKCLSNGQCLISLDKEKDTMIGTTLDAQYAMSINNNYQND